MSSRRCFITKSGQKLEVNTEDIYSVSRKNKDDPDGYVTIRVLDIQAQQIMEQLLYADGNPDNEG